MIVLEPEAGIGDEEGGDLLAAVIVDVGAPVLVKSLARIGMLVEMRAVEGAEAVRIVREMARHPVEDDADPGRVRRLDEGGEILRRAEAARRREERDRLVAPGAVEGILGDRQKLDMREAEVLHVGNQPLAQFAIGEIAVALLRHPRPGAEMALVDRDRRVARIALAAAVHPGAVVPGALRQAVQDGGGRGRLLGGEGHRIGLQRQQVAAGARRFRTCRACRRQLGNEQFPDAEAVAQAHRVARGRPNR